MRLRILAAAALIALTPACTGGDAVASTGNEAATAAKAGLAKVTIASTNGAHVFKVEIAKTPEEQSRGLMYRTNIPKDAGMLFAPYPAEGGGPREASFWMKNTPSTLDIIFIRADKTIARIAENTVPFSETPVPSGEPVAAVLEINGGLSAELGIAEGDRVNW
ncbi:DUF192 domain-containing protein [Sphingomonas sp. SUN019]|uniref:DUF192 domain-containing protein n=1 Tax=Sphingomonas sp. SUN019 TaxID=2937788 RepID=UPI002164D641|nr:DUF192 domain-containing protein [Sphingomonas sp. SUN019]UVO50244.1 DUF192 domain-containing protein [Sphingomonas sp. SUN019]